MRHRGIVASILIAATGAVLMLRHELAGAPPAAPIAAAAPTSDPRVELELATLRAKVAGLEHAAPPTTLAAAAVAAPIDEPAAASLPPPEPPAQLAARLARTVETETDDPAWSRSTEDAITHVVADQAAGSRILDARCRSTICRIEIAHDSDDARRGFLRRVLVDPPFDAPGIAIPAGDPDRADDLRTVIYLARAGHDLPI